MAPMTDATSDLKATLRRDLHTAIREKDTVRSATLRMALTAVTNAEVAGTSHRELTDADVVTVLGKEAKRRREAATAYTDAGRPELAEREVAELAVLEAYLPAQLDDATLDRMAAEAVAETGAGGMQQMGHVMKVLQPRVAGRAEGGRVAAAVRRALDPR
jgi:uncharacterized protein